MPFEVKTAGASLILELWKKFWRKDKSWTKKRYMKIKQAMQWVCNMGSSDIAVKIFYSRTFFVWNPILQGSLFDKLFCRKSLLSLIKFGCNIYYHGPSHISISGVWTFALPIAWESPKTKLFGGGGVPSERIQWLWVRKWNLPSTKLGSTKSHHKQQVRLTMLETTSLGLF